MVQETRKTTKLTFAHAMLMSGGVKREGSFASLINRVV